MTLINDSEADPIRGTITVGIWTMRWSLGYVLGSTPNTTTKREIYSQKAERRE